ncbi:TIGR03089 family protein [Corynebacterium freiburgense]|uniref:TIGR03089 family protein n=1 Tax=Corynebacterium freiburgense TaxID=556548 RepID=UPI000400E8D4|nr:TIGR03089 family protein [Corynebacterium freiburgense]WJZ01899.1 hypothetical protein CFREI_02975 [Corynebacterium freiburgense]
MELLRHLLDAQATTPRLTVYNETTGARLDFSAITLDNWAAKVANMLVEEFDLSPGESIRIDLPAGWQTVVLVLGALAAGIEPKFSGEGDVLFTAPDRLADLEGWIALVSDDPFGRGIAETGGEVPPGIIDFGPTVRLYGDVFDAPTPALPDIVPTSLPAKVRTLATGWTDAQSFAAQVLEPLAAGGSTVIVTGLADATRLAAIAKAERVTLPLHS